tara:strand:+ start:215 stop:418 length:204 start_codon:yes stop_codon:yes gene_type:complete
LAINKANPLKDFLETLRQNTDMLRAYSNKKCNDCLGRGYLKISQPNQSAELYMCSCVVKKAKKEFSK